MPWIEAQHHCEVPTRELDLTVEGTYLWECDHCRETYEVYVGGPYGGQWRTPDGSIGLGVVVHHRQPRFNYRN